MAKRVDLSTLSRIELQKKCKFCGLKTRGKSDELIKRLEEYYGSLVENKKKIKESTVDPKAPRKPTNLKDFMSALKKKKKKENINIDSDDEKEEDIVKTNKKEDDDNKVNDNDDDDDGEVDQTFNSLEKWLTEPSWKNALKGEFKKSYWKTLKKKLVVEEHGGNVIYPPKNQIFEAFKFTPFDKVRVVIVGQDPYHGPNQAHGLCFSVVKGQKIPPSLRNIYKELKIEYPGFVIPNHGYLEKWAKQGILMINAALTVRKKTANHHAKWGWQDFTDEIIRTISKKKKNVVFVLWGGWAKKKAKGLIDEKKHFVFKSAHPSPLSARYWFKNNGCFLKINEHLREIGEAEIDWTLEKN